MSRIAAGLAGFLLSIAAAGSALANSLQAAPVLVEMKAGALSSIITVRNTGNAPIDVQTRVLRWNQSGGQDKFEETRDVVTSPPMLKLQPGVSYSIRLVRTNGQPIRSEEAFRVMVDQLPDPARQQGGTVALVVRHSIPVFVMPESVSGPRVQWSVASRNGRLVLRAENAGDRRLRLSAVNVALPDGRNVSFGSGLLGYVHAGSRMEWTSPAPVSGNVSGARIQLTTDLGPVEAKAELAR
jgi:fimbrial chaperone protein